MPEDRKKRGKPARRRADGSKTERENRLGKLYNVTGRTIRNWENDGIDAEDPEQVAEHLEKLARPSPEALDAIRNAGREVVPIKDIEVTFTTIDATLGELQQQEARLKNLVRVYYDRVEEATKAGRMRDVNAWSKLHKAYEDALTRCKVTQAKLGIEGGELLKREDFKQILRSFFKLSIYGTRRAIVAAADRIAGMTDPSQICAVAESGVLEEAYISPWQAAINRASGLTVPPWTPIDLSEYKDVVTIDV